MKVVQLKSKQQNTNKLTQKNNMFLIDMSGVNVNEEFGSETHIQLLSNDYRYVEITGHKVDYELVAKTGLGVARSHEDEDFKVFYNPNINDSDDDEVMRYGVYYQLTHKDFDDKQLEKLIMSDKVGKVFMEIVFGEHTDELYNRLKEVYDSKKNNVVTFKTKEGN